MVMNDASIFAAAIIVQPAIRSRKSSFRLHRSGATREAIGYASAVGEKIIVLRADVRSQRRKSPKRRERSMFQRIKKLVSKWLRKPAAQQQPQQTAKPQTDVTYFAVDKSSRGLANQAAMNKLRKLYPNGLVR